LAGLRTIPIPLLQELGAGGPMRDAAEQLADQVVALDAVLTDVIELNAVRDPGTALLNVDRIDPGRLYPIFLQIRELKNNVFADDHPMAPVAQLADFVAHTTCNVLPNEARRVRPLATYAFDESRLSYLSQSEHEDVDAGYVQMLAFYLGLSPFPMTRPLLHYFNQATHHDLELGRFGFGVFVYMALALDPNQLELGQLPARVSFRESSRRVAQVRLRQNKAGFQLAAKP
jgi:hypothetical protein